MKETSSYKHTLPTTTETRADTHKELTVKQILLDDINRVPSDFYTRVRRSIMGNYLSVSVMINSLQYWTRWFLTQSGFLAFLMKHESKTNVMWYVQELPYTQVHTFHIHSNYFEGFKTDIKHWTIFVVRLWRFSVPASLISLSASRCSRFFDCMVETVLHCKHWFSSWLPKSGNVRQG